MCSHALTVKRLLEERYIPEITQMENYDGNPVTPPTPIPWYPDNLAWSMTTPKNVIRKYPPFAKFQKFLVSETSVGNISRQEIVSMIPPLLLDVKPAHVVLDLCAAPGSKAAQLAEMIHQGEEGRILKALQLHATEDGREVPEYGALDDVDLEADPTDDGRATGMLVANDMDYKRSHLLIHQLKRLSSPNIIVTNHDATLFPPLKLPSDNSNKQNYLKFDRILADVPCSGDGTLRKNVNLWNDWNPGNALGLHLTQVRILVRALQMLKPGGRVVYSTCSMNPVENESVIAAAIERCGHENVEIVDCSNELTGLKRKPGMKTWKVMDKPGRIWDDWEQVQKWVAEESKDKLVPGKLVPSMFAPKSDENHPEIHLERCIRVYAHQQDTGGFFIVALHKKKEFKAKPEPSAKAIAEALQIGNGTSTAITNVQEPPIKTEDVVAKTEFTALTTEDAAVKSEDAPVETEDAPVEAEDVPVKAENGVKIEESLATEQINPLKRVLEDEDDQSQAKRQHTDSAPAQGEQKNGTSDGYGDKAAKKLNKEPFEEPFKFLPTDNEVIKNVQKFYNISPRFPSDRFMVRNASGEPAKAVYYTSALVRDVLASNEGRSVKFVHGGVKMFMKQDAPSADVCRWRIQSEGMPILQGYVGQERVVVLREKETFRKLLIEMFPMIKDDEWKNLNEIGERVRDVGFGCLVLRIHPDGTDASFSERMALPLWKSFHSLNLMLPKEDRSAMLLRIYNDTTPLVNTMMKDKIASQISTKVDAEANGEGEKTNAEEEADAVANEDIKMTDADADGGAPVGDVEETVQG